MLHINYYKKYHSYSNVASMAMLTMLNTQPMHINSNCVYIKKPGNTRGISKIYQIIGVRLKKGHSQHTRLSNVQCIQH